MLGFPIVNLPLIGQSEVRVYGRAPDVKRNRSVQPPLAAHVGAVIYTGDQPEAPAAKRLDAFAPPGSSVSPFRRYQPPSLLFGNF